MNIALVIITCPGREKELAATIESLQQTDLLEGSFVVAKPGDVAEFTLGGTPLKFFGGHLAMRIQRDKSTFERRQERQEHNSLAALTNILKDEPTADVILFCEDDILFNRHLRHNLEHWKPLIEAVQVRIPCCERDRDRDGNCDRHPEGQAVRLPFFGSLYDPTVREIKAVPEEHYFIADPEAVYGSQCFVMSRPMAEYFVAHWWEVKGMQDIKMSRLAARFGPIHYHLPSLVQHVGVKSTWTSDARFHDTKMYDGEFRA